MHPISFAGAEMALQVNSAGTSIGLEESYQSGGTPTAWVSHPSGIGYRRPGPATGSGSGGGGGGGSGSSSGIPGNAPVMDSGTSDGGDNAELMRLQTYDTGGNENPNSTQAGRSIARPGGGQHHGGCEDRRVGERGGRRGRWQW